MNGVRLLEILEHVAQVCSWGQALYLSLHHSVNCSLQASNLTLINSKSYCNTLQHIKTHSTDSDATLQLHFAKQQATSSIYSNKSPAFISRNIRAELTIIQTVLSSPSIFQWSAPIGHLIPRDANFQSWGDASLLAGGGFSLDLQFWWHIQWPPSITSLTLDKFIFKQKNSATGEIVSINLLEFLVVIVNYIASTVSLQSHPTLNTTNDPLLN